MAEQSLTVKNKSAVTPWASRQDVREMEERIKTMLPGGQKLSTVEVFGLAQAAIAHNLDPFNGEIWCIPGKGLMAGIKGHRRAAHEQINREAGGSGNYYVEFYPLNKDEMTLYKIPSRALAFRARLHDSQTTRNYVENIERLLKAGMPWEIVSKIMGDQPFNDGIGYAMPDHPDTQCPYCHGTGSIMNKWGKQANCECWEDSKMTLVQRAQKRAEAEALKRRFDLPFTMAVGVNGDSDIVDAEFVVHGEQHTEQDPAEVQARMQAASAALRGDQGDLEMEIPYQPEGMPSVEQSVTPPPTENGKSASLKFQAFVTWANEWVKGNGKDYAKPDGLANMYHLLGRIGKLGFASVTEQNADDIKAALESFVKGKVDTQ